MLDFYFTLLKKFDLPEDAYDTLYASGELLYENFRLELESLIKKFYRVRMNVGLIDKDLKDFSETSGTNYFTLCFVFLAFASKYMLEDYKRAGLDEELFWDTIKDLKYKLIECKNVKGVWGTFVIFWYPIFFSLNLYKLGRLEFERTKYSGDEPYRFGDTEIKKGDTVYSVHIPSCGSLSKDLRMDSYRRAFEFFKEERGDKPLICVCHSWLLFEDNRKIFPAKTNLVDFMGDWHIIKNEVSEKFDDAWRVYGRDFDLNDKELPLETTQQRALYEWIKAGNKTGAGFAVLIFDGEKIVNTNN